LCWPDTSGDWYVVELGSWFGTDEVYLFKARSSADVLKWLRGLEQHVRA
jgi:hypothetical protein